MPETSYCRVVSGFHDRSRIQLVAAIARFPAICRLLLLNFLHRICEDILRMPKKAGKQSLFTVFNGGEAPKDLGDEASCYFKRVAAMGRVWRLIAITIDPCHFEKLLMEGGKKWPEASIGSYVYGSVEDFLLRTLLSFVGTYSTEHVSAHFDGIRIDTASATAILAAKRGNATSSDVDIGLQFSALCTETVRNQTGYNISFVPKLHRCLVDLVILSASQNVEDLVDGSVAHHTNRMLVSMSRVRKADEGSAVSADILHRIEDHFEGDPIIEASDMTYKVASKLFGIELHPSFKFNPSPDESMLIHGEVRGRPHPIPCRVHQGGTCSVWIDGVRYEIGTRILRSHIGEAIDRKTFAFFSSKPMKVVDAGLPGALLKLLDMKA